MIQVTRKDQKESLENMLRRLNRRVLQSGVLATVKSRARFSKPESKPDRRKKAIERNRRRAEKLLNGRLGRK